MNLVVERYKFITFIIQVVIFIIVLLHQNKQRFDLKLMDVAREKKSRYQVDVEIKKNY